MDPPETVSLRLLLLQVLPRVLPPLTAYYGARLLGASQYLAIILATLATIAQTIVVSAWRRSLDFMSAVVLVSLVMALATTVAIGEPRAVLVTNCVIGLVYDSAVLLSGVVRRPATLFFAEKLFPRSAKAELAAQGWTAEHFRVYAAFHARTSVLLGFCGVVNSAVCLLIALNASVDIAQAATTVITTGYTLTIPVATIQRVRKFIDHHNQTVSLR